LTKLGIETDEDWSRSKNGKECGNFIWVRLKTISKLREGWIAENRSQVDDRITITYGSGSKASGFAWRKLSEERNRIIDGNETTSNSEKGRFVKGWNGSKAGR
jgi:hypothetical protein